MGARIRWLQRLKLLKIQTPARPKRQTCLPKKRQPFEIPIVAVPQLKSTKMGPVLRNLPSNHGQHAAAVACNSDSSKVLLRDFRTPIAPIGRRSSSPTFTSSIVTRSATPDTRLRTIRTHCSNTFASGRTASIHLPRQASTMASATSIYDFKPLDKKGTEKPMSDFAGKVVLIVNTASKCGFTPQYAGLEKLYKDVTAKHPDEFVILGFPCNQFGGQEPGSDDDIQEFCQLNYGVSFPIMGKIDVNGEKASPLFQYLKNEKPGLLGYKPVKWNFEKFLIGKDGKAKGRWASVTKPESLEKHILAELEAQS
ncbi:thioredoxin-like protein [Pseudomassariella vexata]|uniref:Glutathione peroxidase n=1 Tax=Pseudomassariella vexata TaxID=1141098 RepID=A0A1Y2EHU0_9PEZI|nr:thioredoxin-like protein [Pseudomassariella vexata]ORY71141.1 thioredoxin-like protein [Pseudomassariella vexata]